MRVLTIKAEHGQCESRRRVFLDMTLKSHIDIEHLIKILVVDFVRFHEIGPNKICLIITEEENDELWVIEKLVYDKTEDSDAEVPHHQGDEGKDQGGEVR